MGQWNHPMCDACWTDRMGDRVPVRFTVLSRSEACCFCGEASWSGIYVREDPDVPVYHKPHSED